MTSPHLDAENAPSSPPSPPRPTSPLFTPTEGPTFPTADETSGVDPTSSTIPPDEIRDFLDGRGSGSGSSPRSTRPASRRELKRMTAAVVKTAGGAAHLALTRGRPADRDAGLWLPDDEDVNDMADPLAGLASRRAPEGAANPDTGDLVALVMAFVRYVLKQLGLGEQLAEEMLGDVVDHAAGVDVVPPPAAAGDVDPTGPDPGGSLTPGRAALARRQ